MENVKRSFFIFSIFLIYLLVLFCSTAIGATHHIEGFVPENICDTNKIAITYVDADGDYSTGAWVGGTWYPNETQVAVYYIQGDLSVGGDTINFGFCGTCNSIFGICQDWEQVEGKFVIRFIDVLAPGWVWDSPSTWKEKKIKKISWRWWHSINDPLHYNNPYMQAKAYEHWSANNMVDSRSIFLSTAGSTETIESSTGFSELYFSTDFMLSTVWDMWVYADPPVTISGRDEIIGAWNSSGFSGIYYGDFAAGKWTKMWSNVPSGDIAAGDFSGDGKADVASNWGTGLWYQNGATLGWTKLTSTASNRLTAGDITGDGRAELIGTWNSGGFSGIYYGDFATKSWTQMYPLVPPGDIAAGDFTGDGRADVASNWSVGDGLWYQNGATLGWTKITSTPSNRLTAGDVTGDGRVELIGTWTSGGIRYWNFVTSSWTTMYSGVPSGDIAAGDFTGDGKADVAANWSSGLWYQNGATLGWTKASSIACNSVTAGDVTGD